MSSATGATAASLALATCHNGAGACTTGNADVTFTTTGIGFNAGSAVTVATWLGTSAFTLNNLVDTIGAQPMDSTIWEFVGNAKFTSPQAFIISHDDGVTFVANGQTVVNDPGPTSVFTVTPPALTLTGRVVVSLSRSSTTSAVGARRFSRPTWLGLKTRPLPPPNPPRSCSSASASASPVSALGAAAS